MESYKTENLTNPVEQNQNVDKTESAENFQKFIYELFDKNGILNDLRAYLRGHIVNVLKSAQTGDPPSFQKHFSQRLDSTFQALNMLVAEYLLCLEFNYSLSVFVSEIPLANMVFGFAKSLMDLGADGEAAGLRFGENDVWSILNYLGIKCDSEHVNKIMEMYKTQVKSPLLLCILKCAELCDSEPLYSVSSREGSISTSSKSSNTDRRRSPHQCKHHAFCKACRSRFRHIKEKYRRKKKRYMQKAQASINAMNVDNLMKNIGDMERGLIDEMFEQLKTVYEAEIDMFKTEHEGKIKSALASQVQRFQKLQKELEESFKAREAALESNVVNKKRFLWGLAQTLRLQHSQMTKAMQAVKKQTALLADQEQSLKIQRTEAEQSLKKHAEEMRLQIADELIILERHLESMKTERDTINRERIHLDKVSSENKLNDNEVKNYLQTHYNLLKDELGVLKMYIENATFQPRSVVERSTGTEEVSYKETMNNETAKGLVREETRPHQVVNDLKKQKNVNFSQGKSEAGSRESRSDSSSSEDLCRTQAENERLRNLARQQTQMTLLSAQVGLQPVPRPRTAPAAAPRLERSMHDNDFGWRAGAGEEHGLVASARVLVPGDTLPFVGVVGRRADSRRHLLNRWRALRRRMSPLGSPDLASRSVATDRPAENIGIRIHSPSSEPTRGKEDSRQQESVLTPTRDKDLRSNVTTGSPKKREKSPRSVLKEAKEKLKTVTRASASREKSPSAMLREAKLRLRKLEIEAEAVERSYMDFRRRRELCHPERAEESCIPHPTSKLETHHRDETPGHSKSEVRATDSMNFELDKYLKKYNINLNAMGQEHFMNKNTALGLKHPVPQAYSEIDRNVEPIPKHDYLEEPISEFRKLYYTNPVRIRTNSPISVDFQEPSTLSNINSENALKEKCSEMRNEKNNKRKELEILKQNISKIYDLEDEPTKETQEIIKEPEDSNMIENMLTVEVENVSEVRDLKVASSDTEMLLVVKGSVDSKDVMSDYEDKKDQISTKMTIVISPKQINVNEDANDRIESSRPPSPIRANLIHSNAITEFYEASGDKGSDIHIEIRNDPDSEIQIDAGDQQVSEIDEAPDDYPDDFSYDVDNYKSEYDNSPISLPKTSEDENFWD